MDRITHFKMEDLPNVIQVVFTHAVPHQAGAVTLMHTAIVLNAMTSGRNDSTAGNVLLVTNFFSNNVN